MAPDTSLNSDPGLSAYLSASDEAYACWMRTSDDYFGEDDTVESQQEFVDRVSELLEASSTAGADLRTLLPKIAIRYPVAASSGLLEVFETPGVDEPDYFDEAMTEIVEAGLSTRSCPGCGSPINSDAQYCSKCGGVLPELTAAELLPIIEALRREIAGMRRTAGPALPQTDILSPDFLKRAFAIYGHVFVVSLIISIPAYLLVLVFTLAIR